MSAATSPGGPRPTTPTAPGSTPMPIQALAKPCRRSSLPPIGPPMQRRRSRAPACWPPSPAPRNMSGCFGTAPINAAPGLPPASAADRLVAEAVAPALDVADRRRREVHRAAQGRRVAIALEEAAPGRRGLLLIEIDAHHQVGIARLDRRMDQIAGEHRPVAALSGTDREMVGGVAWGRHQPGVVIERVIAGHQLGLLGVDDRQ